MCFDNPGVWQPQQMPKTQIALGFLVNASKKLLLPRELFHTQDVSGTPVSKHIADNLRLRESQVGRKRCRSI
jgi:hypothetical protein